MSEHRLRDTVGLVRVYLSGNGDTPTVLVDDVPHVVARLHRGPRIHHAGTTTEVATFDLAGRPVHALVTRGPQRIIVTIDGQTYDFATGDDLDATTAGRLGSGTVNAPMPGKIIAVLVHEGAAVTIGQGLVVLEAMKMESTLAAEIAGTVTRVTVAAGDLIDGGALLVEITAA